MAEPYILVIGESLVDVMLAPDGVEEHPGGSPMNVAVGLARLGHQVVLATWIGRDARGQVIKEHLANSGVRLLPTSEGAQHTPTATIIKDANGNANYQFDIDWHMPALPAELFDQPPKLVHTGSIGASKLPGAYFVLNAVRRFKPISAISFDPNVRPNIVDLEVANAYIYQYTRLVDIFKASREDMDVLYPEKGISMGAAWMGMGAAILSFTLGSSGAIGMNMATMQGSMGPGVDPESRDAFGALDKAGLQVAGRLVDTVGAGDAFTAALIDGLDAMGLLGWGHRGDLSTMGPDELGRLQRYATTAAGICCTRAGADPPWRAELPPFPDEGAWSRLPTAGVSPSQGFFDTP